MAPPLPPKSTIQSDIGGASDNLNTARSNASAVLLVNGLVLVAGGCVLNCLGATTATAEIHSSVNRKWSITGSMAAARVTSSNRRKIISALPRDRAESQQILGGESAFLLCELGKGLGRVRSGAASSLKSLPNHIAGFSSVSCNSCAPAKHRNAVFSGRELSTKVRIWFGIE